MTEKVQRVKKSSSYELRFLDMTTLQLAELIFSPTTYRVPVFLHCDHLITELLVFNSLAGENGFTILPPNK